MIRTSIRFSWLTSAALATSLLLASACSDSKDNGNNTPSNAMGGSAATGGAPADTGGAAADTGGAGNDATGGADSTTGGNTSAAGGAATGGASTSDTCTDDPKTPCYECSPTTNDQILTACSGAMCRPFDNTARGVPAALPAIP